MTPTGVSLAELDPAELSRLDATARLIDGRAPTKELPLHLAMYGARPTGEAIVHLHATHSVALSTLPAIDPTEAVRPLTAYYVMRVGRTVLLPYFRPGDPAVAEAIREQAGSYGAVLLAHHGPVVAGRTLAEAGDAIEELEQTARIQLLLGTQAATLPEDEIEDLRRLNFGT